MAHSGRFALGTIVVLALLYGVTHWVLHRGAHAES